MRNLKFLIFAFGLMLAQGVLAVTLPTTSYTEYSSAEASYDDYSSTGVALPSSSFLQLGEIDYSECTSYPTFQGCEQCCNQKVKDCYSDPTITDKSECNALSSACNNSCGRSLPIDGGMGILLVLSVLAGALKPLLRRS